MEKVQTVHVILWMISGVKQVRNAQLGYLLRNQLYYFE